MKFLKKLVEIVDSLPGLGLLSIATFLAMALLFNHPAAAMTIFAAFWLLVAARLALWLLRAWRERQNVPTKIKALFWREDVPEEERPLWDAWGKTGWLVVGLVLLAAGAGSNALVAGMSFAIGLLTGWLVAHPSRHYNSRAGLKVFALVMTGYAFFGLAEVNELAAMAGYGGGYFVAWASWGKGLALLGVKK